MTDPSVDVGWYPDPADPVFERWWDGLAWTQYRRPVAQSLPARARRTILREPVRPAPDDHTPLRGWIVGSPFWAGPVLVVLSIVGDWTTPAVLLGLVVMVLCLLDWWVLRRRGFSRLPSLWWLLLGPIGYLVGRRRALGGPADGSVWIVAGGWALFAVPIFIFSAVWMGIYSTH